VLERFSRGQLGPIRAQLVNALEDIDRLCALWAWRADNHLAVRYEELAAGQDKVLAAIAGFLGVPPFDAAKTCAIAEENMSFHAAHTADRRRLVRGYLGRLSDGDADFRRKIRISCARLGYAEEIPA
jgi:hypothetical protein